MTQKTALVTGASRGIGQAIANRLVTDGFYVFGTATTQSGADRVSLDLDSNGSGVPLQLTDAHSIDGALQTIADSKRTISVLVNNAGITRDSLLLRMSDLAWDEVLNTNLTGFFRITKPLLRGMLKERWGRIVNLGSVVARMGNAGQANYCATKAGIEGFTRSLAMEVASRGITVNCVAPGFISTDMTTEVSERGESDLLARVPLGRAGTPEDIANAVAFLVSTDASYITGQTIHVNGGMLTP